MKTLILSCNTGEGHNSCAKAIKEYYDTVGDECVIKDGLEFISPKVSNFISWGHTFIYRHLPLLFKYGYVYIEKHPTMFKEGSFAYRFITRGTERMYTCICDEQYDIIICTHVFASLMLTDMLKKHPMNQPTALVSTDYTCSPSTKDSNLDYYFIPDDEFATDFECRTITEEKLISSGIPVRQMFYRSIPKEEAKMSVGVQPNHHHLILMCGSMGCGPMEKLLHKLSQELPVDWEVSVICGRNTKLADKLNKKYENIEQIHINGFVRDMGMMMDSADLYLTKPGGISVTEALAKSLPMIFIDAVAGCEEYNRIHFIRKGGAKTGVTTSELTEVCLSLMLNESKRQMMNESLFKMEKRNASQIIFETMKKLMEERDAEITAKTNQRPDC